mmetsp:Transcript_20495/g.26518  ORF Transcript_20495/g.26518 Transcript_20495/m.26518 type:complete len:387 (-) Transcript_20495:153-1313(-)
MGEYYTGTTSSRVRLDVGGRIFVSSVPTLTAASAYFRARFSDEWCNEVESSSSIECFLDQDPGPFEHLLSFMRNGFIKSEDINEGVLIQAEFLGIERLLQAVKCWASLQLHPHRFVCVDDSKANTKVELEGILNEIVSSFDEEYGGIMGAIATGILPSSLMCSLAAEEKEYSSITLIRKAGHIPLISVHAPGLLVDQNYEQSYPPRLNRFILALSWCYRVGFVQEDSYKNGVGGNFDWRRLTFSRESPTYSDSIRSIIDQYLSCILIQSGTTYEKRRQKARKKEFAMIVLCQHQNDDGNLPPYAVAILDPKARDGSCDVKNEKEMSQVADLSTFPGIDEAMNYVVKKSYIKRENEIEDFYRSMLVEGGAVEILIFSRLSSISTGLE